MVSASALAWDSLRKFNVIPIPSLRYIFISLYRVYDLDSSYIAIIFL